MPSLDVPVPQMVDQLLDIEHFFAALSPDPEQVIEVPKISFDRVSQRLVERRLPQIVEQLVEVPTVLTPTRIALQIAEQLVAIPVLQVSVSGGGHQGSLSGQGSVGEQIVDIPVPRGRGKRRVHGFLPEQSSTAQPVEQLVDIPSSRRGLYGSLPEQGTTAQTVEQIVDIPSGGVCGPGSSSAAAAADEDFTGVFRTFPHGKKVRSAGQVSADLPRHVSSSTPAAQPVSWWASLTPAQQPELEEARAEVRREHVSKRKRKKRRKRRTPRTSSLPGRARRRQRQWFACSAGFFW